MKGLRLIATGGALPGRTVTNEELSRTVDTSDEWITTRTGIRTRHYCTEGENAATLAVEVLSVQDNVGKADAAAMYREIPADDLS